MCGPFPTALMMISSFRNLNYLMFVWVSWRQRHIALFIFQVQVLKPASPKDELKHPIRGEA